MDKNNKKRQQKSHRYILEHPREFTISVNGNLHCNICCTELNPERKSVIDEHRKTKKHSKGIFNLQDSKIQSFLVPRKDEFANLLLEAFVATDIPLYKLENERMKKLFNYMNYPLPARTTLRTHLLENMAPNVKTAIKNDLRDRKFFLIIDESSFNEYKYLNILGGRLDESHKIYALNVYSLQRTPSGQTIVEKISETITEYNLAFTNFFLLISDAATYMKKAAELIKISNNNFLHITCLAHLMHNLSMKIKLHYQNVDKLISTMKMLTLKNTNNQKIFEQVGHIPSPIVTRWASWLKAACFYADKLPEVRKLMVLVKKEGIIAENAHVAVFEESLMRDLFDIKINYQKIIFMLEKLETGELNIFSGYNCISTLFCSNDILGFKDYISIRLKESDFESIVYLKNENISPADYILLHNCPCTSIAVERSFSMLKRMLRSERNFNVKNVESYFLTYYNFSNNENGRDKNGDDENYID